MSKTNPVTLITGAAGALGGAVISHLREQRHRIAAVDLPGASERLEQLGEGVFGLAFDANDADGWSAPLQRAEAELGPVTGAVLCAGAWQGGGPLHARADDAVWRAMMSANLESVYRAMRAVLPGMVARGSGSIVVIGSRVVLRPESAVGAAEYAAAKNAVVAMAQAVAAEVLESGVRVNAVLPSTIDTQANRKAMPNADATKWVSPGSIAELIAFLLSDGARDICGAAIPIYGRA